MLIISNLEVTTATDDEIRKIILAGTNILRHNFPHYPIDAHIDYLSRTQKIITELNAKVFHLIDLPRNKVRLGDFNQKLFAVRENEEFIMKSASFSPDCNEFIPVNTEKLGDKVKLDQTITLGDGEIAIQVIDIIDNDTIKIRTLNNGLIRFMIGFNLQTPGHGCDQMMAIYNEILEKTMKFEPRFLAVPTMDEKYRKEFRQLPTFQNSRFRRKLNIIAKISTKEGIDDIEKICADDFYQMIMVNRGGLGVNLPFEKYGLIQQHIMAVAKKHSKPVILSSHMLDSTANNYVPSRADICNLTEAVQNGVFAVSLEQESNLNRRSVYPISVAKKIIAAAKHGL